MKLNAKTVAGLGLPPGKRDHVFFDDDLKGFGLRIRAGGKRTWIANYRTRTGVQRRSTLGPANVLDADQARKAAKELLAKAALGGDPQGEKAAARAESKLTLGAIVEQYLAVKATLRPNTVRALKLYLRTHWHPLHGEAIHELTKRQVAAQIGEIAETSGNSAAARARIALSALYSWAIGQGLCDGNPVIGTNRPDQGDSRSRVLQPEELGQVWEACRNDDHGRCIKLLMLTGQRREEVGGMRWSELDLDKALWIIPAARTKNHREHVVPLSAAALAIIGAIPRRGDCLFGSKGYRDWTKAKRRLDARVSLAPWRVHDIRRSMATGMAENGTPPHVVEAVLNHVSGHKAGVAGVYNRATYLPERKQALSMWADHIRALIEGSERKLVPLRAR